MSRFVKSFAANTFRAAAGTAVGIAGLSCAALALSASAAAEPAVPAPAIPGVPALTMLQEFATNPASMGAVLQTAATALNGASSMIGGPAPSTLPVSPIAGAPATAPVADPAAALPMGPGSTLVPLLNQLGVPANLAGLTPADLPMQIGDALGLGEVDERRHGQARVLHRIEGIAPECRATVAAEGLPGRGYRRKRVGLVLQLGDDDFHGGWRRGCRLEVALRTPARRVRACIGALPGTASRPRTVPRGEAAQGRVRSTSVMVSKMRSICAFSMISGGDRAMVSPVVRMSTPFS